MSRLRGPIGRAALALLIALLPLAIGFVWFATHLPEPTEDRSHTDAIVVLTGGSDRLGRGLALLQEGLAHRLLISGVHPGVEKAELLRLAHLDPDAPLAGRVDIGHEAGDTFGNAAETQAWMEANHFHSLRLVTADYHMRRALIEFRLAAPELDILPNPVRPPSTATAGWWLKRDSLNLMIAEYGKYLIVKWRYTLARLTGHP